MNSPVKVIPAILTDDPVALKDMLRQTQKFNSYVQIDVMDGQFVPSRSITWEHITGLPITLRWEAHLMVMQPETHFGGYKRAGAEKVIFHYEAASSPQEIIAQARELGLKVGLAVNPETLVEAVASSLAAVDSILLLTVHPGYYGSPFLPEVMDKVAQIRALRPGLQIDVDGGIKESNIAQVARQGVDGICVGSAIFRQPDPAASYRRLLELAQGS